MEVDAIAAEQPGSGQRRLCIALLAFAILSIVGLFITLELTDVWVRARVDPDYQSFCAVNEGMNCETVALSEFSSVMGGPVSVWASSGYIFIAFLAFLSLFRAKDGFGRGYLFLFSSLFGVVSLLLVYVMKFVIGSWCLLCLAVDAVNFGLLAMSIMAIKVTGASFFEAIRFDFESIIRRPLPVALLAVAGFSCLGGAYVYGTGLVVDDDVLTIGSQEETKQHLDAPENWASQVHQGECSGECGCGGQDRPQPLQMGEDAGGHHWIGAEDAILEIQEFTDYQCPYCRKAHMMVRNLLSNHPGKIKVFHRHYPLDNACNRIIDEPFHHRACEFSKIASCAGQQGRFWEMNDFLFQHAREIRKEKLSADEIAKRLELNQEDFECCMADDRVTEAIKQDIEAGIEHELRGTPAFLVNDKVYYGKIPEEAVGQLR